MHLPSSLGWGGEGCLGDTPNGCRGEGAERHTTGLRQLRQTAMQKPRETDIKIFTMCAHPHAHAFHSPLWMQTSTHTFLKIRHEHIYVQNAPQFMQRDSLSCTLTSTETHQTLTQRCTFRRKRLTLIPFFLLTGPSLGPHCVPLDVLAGDAEGDSLLRKKSLLPQRCCHRQLPACCPSGDQRPGLTQIGKLGPRHRVGSRQPAQARNGGPVWEQAGYTEGRAPKRPVGAWPGVGEAEGRDPVWPVGPVLSLAQGGGWW